MEDMKRGLFFAFEGIDGSGKGTQIRKLKKRLEKESVRVFCTMIGRIQTTNDVIAALFVADRLDHIRNGTNGILRFLENGVHVITDRYYFSSYAYQSVDLPMDWIIEANRPAAALLRPDLNIFIDVDPEVTMARIERNRMTKELFEQKERLVETRKRYFEAFALLKDEERVLIIDGNRDEDEVAEDIWKNLSPLL